MKDFLCRPRPTNRKLFLCGATDIALTALEHDQAEELGRRIHDADGPDRAVQFCDMTNEEFVAFGLGNCQVLAYKWQK